MRPRLHRVLAGPAGAPALVLVNSIGTTLEMWDGQAPALAERFRLVRYDQLGHGRSGVPPGPYEIDGLARLLLDLLDELEVERFSLCGISLGGMVAIAAAAAAPERLERLVLCSTAPYLGDEEEVWLQRAATVRAEGAGAVAAGAVSRWLTPGLREREPGLIARLERMVASTPAEGYAACCDAIRTMDLRPRLAAVAAPTLVLAGAEDAAIPAEHGERLAAALPSARFELLRDAAHLPNLEHPAEFTRLLGEHLAA